MKRWKIQGLIFLLLASLMAAPLFAAEEGTMDPSQDGAAGQADQSEPYRLFDYLNLEGGFTLAYLPGFSNSVGVSFPVSIGYFALDHLVGEYGSRGMLNTSLRWEPGFAMGISETAIGITAFQSFSLGLDYWFRFTPEEELAVMGGISFGSYQAVGGTLDSEGNSEGVDGTFFGISPRVGYRGDGMNYFLAYHIIFTPAGTANPSYLVLGLSWMVGGDHLTQ